jgi:hypothetical protein
VLLDQIREQSFELDGVFARNDDATGSEPVFEGVAAGDGFTFGCAGSGGTGSLGRGESRSGDRLADQGVRLTIGRDRRLRHIGYSGAGVDASADGGHSPLLFGGEFLEEVGIWRESRSGDRLAGRTAGPTGLLSGGSGCAALPVSEFSSLALSFAALFAEFA